jgi:serine/threonine-protein kinase
MTLDRRRVVDALPTYDVGREIGRGGWAVVLHARHRILEREVAVKHLPVAFGADPTVRARFVAEAKLVARLDHPHIVPVYDFVESDGTYLILMEYLPGGSLWDRFQETGVRPDEACAYVLVACSALAHAHEHGALHRDIKPENFLLDDRPGVVKLGDFGVAKALGAAASQFTSVGQVVGTPAYLAPEQVRGDPVTPATDVFGCATMLYELLSGTLPYPSDRPVSEQLRAKLDDPARPLLEVAPTAPAPVAAVVMRGLAADPLDRYATVVALGEALAVAATQAFGPGWLRTSGVRLDGSPDLLAITERQPVGASTADDAPARAANERHRVRATTVHHRLNELVAEARDTAPPAAVHAANPSTTTTSATEAPASAASSASGIGPGWYVDPTGRSAQRWWDGTRWTAHVATDGGALSTDDLA